MQPPFNLSEGKRSKGKGSEDKAPTDGVLRSAASANQRRESDPHDQQVTGDLVGERDQSELRGQADRGGERNQSEVREQSDRRRERDQGAHRDQRASIAEVSHELRLPIANIRLLVETLLDGALEDLDVSRRMLKRAHQEVDRLQRLVSDLLSDEQLLDHTGELQRHWLNLKERAGYASETVATMALSKGVEVKLSVADHFSVYANGEQLDQVLLNLVENAVKFTEPGGTVTIASLDRPGCFSVSDSGIGMSEHEIPKIFQRFYRIDRSQSKGSTGLGLSIVKHILDMHGGRITVASKEKIGSTFEVEFPPPQS